MRSSRPSLRSLRTVTDFFRCLLRRWWIRLLPLPRRNSPLLLQFPKQKQKIGQLGSNLEKIKEKRTCEDDEGRDASPPGQELSVSSTENSIPVLRKIPSAGLPCRSGRALNDDDVVAAPKEALALSLKHFLLSATIKQHCEFDSKVAAWKSFQTAPIEENQGNNSQNRRTPLSMSCRSTGPVSRVFLCALCRHYSAGKSSSSVCCCKTRTQYQERTNPGKKST